MNGKERNKLKRIKEKLKIKKSKIESSLHRFLFNKQHRIVKSIDRLNFSIRVSSFLEAQTQEKTPSELLVQDTKRSINKDAS